MNSLSIELICTQSLSVLRQFQSVKLAFLFGSAAKNRMRHDSDIDIGIAGDQVFSIDELFEIREALIKGLKKEIDLLDIRNNNGLIRSEILCKGIQIFSRDTLLLASIMKEVVYFNDDFLSLQNELLDKKIRRFAFGR